MGCDIHMYGEIQIEGRWRPLKPVVPSEWYKQEWPRLFRDRNYNLFAMLANVRNGFGVAGIETGSGFAVIHSPRGLPADLSDEYKRAQEQADRDSEKAEAPHLWFGDHSFSWATLAELLRFDWTRTTALVGVVNIMEFAKWQHWAKFDGPLNHGPDSWCACVSGAKIRHVSNAEAEELMKRADIALKAIGDERRFPPLGLGTGWRRYPGHLPANVAALVEGVHTQIEWPVTYWHCAARFLSNVIPELLAAANKSGAGFDGVRIVYGFDS